MALSGGFTRGRRLAGAAEGLGAVLVVAALVAAATYAATRPALRARLDLTEGASFTLSEQTRSILRELEVPVTATVLMRPELQRIPNGLTEVQGRAIRYVDNLLEAYALASGGELTVRRIDPTSELLETGRLAKELHLTRYNVVVLQGPTRTRQVFLEDLVTIDRGLADPEAIQTAELVDLRGEAPLTSAILAVTYEQAPRIGLLRGFGGPGLDDPTDPFGLSVFAEALRGQGLDPQAVELTGEDSLPPGLEVVVVWGPSARLGARVTAALEDYHRRGGAVLLGLDPLLEDADLDRWLAQLGIARERTVLCRPDEHLQGPRRAVLAIQRFQPDHPITAPIERQGYFAVVDHAGGLRGTSAASLLALTGPEVFGDLPAGDGLEGDYLLGEGELDGSRAVALALQPADAGKLVIFAASSFLTDQYLRAEGGRANLDLGLNSVNWLVGREEAIEARPRQVFESRVELLDEERRLVGLYVLGLMPLGGVLLGLLTWWARRR
ncbi:MAG TPA: GldG family protein [Planctomycetota bacterium]|nr:GldG family protein [Planctomycetota bacterium]